MVALQEVVYLWGILSYIVLRGTLTSTIACNDVPKASAPKEGHNRHKTAPANDFRQDALNGLWVSRVRVMVYILQLFRECAERNVRTYL
jgi:hypothetical protein